MHTPTSLLAALAFASPASAQPLDFPVVPGVAGEVDSEFTPLICYDWVLGQPTFACPGATASSLAVSGCVSVTVDAIPASTLTLRGFEVEYEALPPQTVSYLGQGTLTHTIGATTVRMDPSSGPIEAVYDAANDVFVIENGVPIQVEGLVTVSGTGAAGMAFPVTVMDLSTFDFPLATVATNALEIPATGEDAVVLSVLLGAPLFEPGGRLDVGSGFVVGLGGGLLAPATGASCADEPVCAADTNGDGTLSPADFNAWIVAFNSQAPACDQNGDELCTPTDFSAWVINFNAGCP